MKKNEITIPAYENDDEEIDSPTLWPQVPEFWGTPILFRRGDVVTIITKKHNNNDTQD